MAFILVKLRSDKTNLVGLVNALPVSVVLLQIIRRGRAALVEVEGDVSAAVNAVIGMPEVIYARPIQDNMDIIALGRGSLVNALSRRFGDMYSSHALFRVGFDYASSMLDSLSMAQGGYNAVELIMDVAWAMGYFDDYSASQGFSRIYLSNPFDAAIGSQFMLGFINGTLNTAIGRAFGVELSEVAGSRYTFVSRELM
ncbi:hypothetical protein GCM10007981_18180 [Thermocladium modestius]|uniref:Uncharacterized protein n=1 Tax=Thermocladium modestius TaxID=62609 RepID=A0A830GXS2_9CREN|nr:hypothetical protein [Thermocladium modestius]GGP22374.1 hypothetical protein GCM10007981_18180 [Thermocladium modestius]